jgi:hypothetical protein
VLGVAINDNCGVHLEGGSEAFLVLARHACLQYHGQHALRDRARKIDQGILIIRFEVPFHIWCSKCGEKIAKGELSSAKRTMLPGMRLAACVGCPCPHVNLMDMQGTSLAVKDRRPGWLQMSTLQPHTVWCSGDLSSHVLSSPCMHHCHATGERFNAEKKGIGFYHSTRIWQFSMRHHCGCIITIQTDPKKAEYLVVEGARKKVGICTV